MLPLADVHERTDEVAHHVVKKRVGADHEIYPLPSLLDLQRTNSPDRRFRLALRGTEGRKVVLADEERSRFPHLAHIERKVKPPDVRRRECGAYRAVEKPVAVSARESAVARVEVGGDLARPEDGHGIG